MEGLLVPKQPCRMVNKQGNRPVRDNQPYHRLSNLQERSTPRGTAIRHMLFQAGSLYYPFSALTFLTWERYAWSQRRWLD